MTHMAVEARYTTDLAVGGIVRQSLKFDEK